MECKDSKMQLLHVHDVAFSVHLCSILMMIYMYNGFKGSREMAHISILIRLEHNKVNMSGAVKIVF